VQKQTQKKENATADKKETYPLHGKSTIYHAKCSVTGDDNNKEKAFLGLPNSSFKTRCNGHILGFKNTSKKSSTTLSKYPPKSKEIECNIKWRLTAKMKCYSPAVDSCNSCLKMK